MTTNREIILFSTVFGISMILAGGFWGFLVPFAFGSLAPILTFAFIMGTVIYGTINA